ncbi:L,D-transpeptidase [Mesorhizobium sp. ISC25]|uniref:L,D-transpeptidase n=1 Tax=Mesorhizobium sp. ISC25 TaxID=3077335 RepID=UPI0035DB3259
MIHRRDVTIGLGALGFFATTKSAPTSGADLVIKVNLPLDRTKTGTLSLEAADGSLLVSDLDVLGKADNQKAISVGNVNREPTLPFGDTPEGTYSVPRLTATGDGTNYSTHSYGPNGAIVLKPESGQAKQADANNRIGLLIHGGDLGGGGKLRATHGCLRLSNDDMAKLIQAIGNAGNNTTFNRCEIVRVSVLVGGDAEEGAGDDEMDPPPGIGDLLNPIPIGIP